MPLNRDYVRKAITPKPLEPRCCPECLRLMRHKDGVWRCPKHGEPTRP